MIAKFNNEKLKINVWTNELEVQEENAYLMKRGRIEVDNGPYEVKSEGIEKRKGKGLIMER